MIELPATFTVQCPTCYEQAIQFVLSFLIDTNGGAYSYPVSGWWKNNEGQIIKDDMTMIVSASEHPLEPFEIEHIVRLIKVEAKQEAVCFTINDKMYII